MGTDRAARKYERVAGQLRQQIDRGDYPPGARLPSQAQICKAFGVSRPTAIDALRVLRAEGRIRTEAGSGAFVLGPDERRAAAGVDAGAGWARIGGDLLDVPERERGANLVQAGFMRAPSHVRAGLGLAPGAMAFLRRLVDGGGGPAGLVSVWLPLGLADGTDLAGPELLGEGLRRHLQARKKMRLGYAGVTISARRAGLEEAGLLPVDAGTPVLHILATAFDAGGGRAVIADRVLCEGRTIRSSYLIG